MNDDELRSLIRAAIQKHMGGAVLVTASACREHDAMSFGETGRVAADVDQLRSISTRATSRRHVVPDRAGGPVQSLRFL